MWIMRLRIALHIFIHSRWPLRLVVGTLVGLAGMILMTCLMHDLHATLLWGVIFMCEAVITMLAWRRTERHGPRK